MTPSPSPSGDKRELKELLAKATPGPWQVDDGDCGIWGIFADCAAGDCDAISYMVDPVSAGYQPLRPAFDEANARLIVVAVNALPDLLAELESLQARLAEATKALERCRDKFREYEAIHAAKKSPEGVGPWGPGGSASIGAKVVANREMAEMCEAAFRFISDRGDEGG